MSIKLHFSQVILFVLSFSLLFISCGKDMKDDNIQDSPPSENIVIDENSIYNQDVFIKSFEQTMVFFYVAGGSDVAGGVGVGLTRGISFTHQFDNDGKLLASTIHADALKELGKNYFTVTHTHDTKGVTTSSSLPGFILDHEEYVSSYTWQYEYDDEGYFLEISFVSSTYSVPNDSSTLTLQYDAEKRLISAISNYESEIDTCTLNYNSNGKIESLTSYDDGPKYIFQIIYTSDGERIQEIREYEANKIQEADIYKFTYDNQNRVIRYEENIFAPPPYHAHAAVYNIYEYTNDRIIEKEYYTNDNKISTIEEYKEQFRIDTSYIYLYTVVGNQGNYTRHLNGCLKRVHADDRYRTLKTFYYGGTSINSLELKGYSVGTEWHPQALLEIKKKIYDANDVFLYDVEILYPNNNYTKSGEDLNNRKFTQPDGTVIHGVSNIPGEQYVWINRID